MYDIYFDLEDMHQTIDDEITASRDDHDSWAFESIDFDFVKDLPVKQKSEGCFCAECNNFCQYAETNQSDGSFICYSCRNY